MSVKSFKFVSPGVFINEIDNSFIPKSADAIGPVILGRSTRGLAMTPVKVESYSQFVEMFGDTVPGNAGGDISRNGNGQSPMYGTYAAKAFLNANVAPLTYIRLLGQQSSNASTDSGYAGWKTAGSPVSGAATPGIPPTSHNTVAGAFGLWVFPSASIASAGQLIGTGSLAAVWYVEKSGSIMLTGSLANSPAGQKAVGLGKLISNDASSKDYTVQISNEAAGTDQKITFNFDDSSENFIRKVFNTNPQVTTANGAFYPAASAKNYWLGQTYEQELRTKSIDGAKSIAVILPIASGSARATGPHNLRSQASREAVAGWFVGQDLGAAADYQPEALQKLFRLKGRGHGEWLHKNLKVSIEKIRQSNTSISDYGSFSVVLRSLSDTDNKVIVHERFDGCTLDPASPNFVARLIGDKYSEWDSVNRRLKVYGEYENNSKYVYVTMDSTVEAGGTDPLLLPFGYYGPPKFKDLSTGGTMSATTGVPAADTTSYIQGSTGFYLGAINNFLTSALPALDQPQPYGVLSFPSVNLRVSASDAGLSDPTNAYFGMSVRRSATSTMSDPSVKDYHSLLYSGFPDDPTSAAINGVNAFSYIFSMDDIEKSSTDYCFASGSRKAVPSTSVSGKAGQNYKTLLDAGYDRFTAPFWGGFDGFDIHYPDPLYNEGIGTSATEVLSSPYYTYRQAIDTVADPEAIDMNLLSAPGLTVDALTTHMINVCEERADALAIVDLAKVYIPAHEKYNSNKKDRVGTTPTAAATALRNRRLDSSYGCTFYPWVQTRDTKTGQLLWVPPSVAMVGVLASSQARSDVWFAPAGFNRGGLSDGAAGIPVTGITERLVSKDRDILYESRINPIASFPSSGIVVFGQKTLQERQSALDRINVRRLVIYLKKQISILSTQVLFEQNVQATWNRFKSLIEPFLANVKVQFGITDYKLILDESTTTPDLIDQNILYAKIMVKPARAIEYIAIDFVIASTGASFDD